MRYQIIITVKYYYIFEYTLRLRLRDKFYKVRLFLRLDIDSKPDSSLYRNDGTFFLHSGRTFVLRNKNIILIYISRKPCPCLTLHFRNFDNPFIEYYVLKQIALQSFRLRPCLN